MRACAWRFALIAVFALALRCAAGIDAKCSACAAVAVRARRTAAHLSYTCLPWEGLCL
jgi:hypothetical protein